jgi:hypothetical protein
MLASAASWAPAFALPPKTVVRAKTPTGERLYRVVDEDHLLGKGKWAEVVRAHEITRDGHVIAGRDVAIKSALEGQPAPDYSFEMVWEPE